MREVAWLFDFFTKSHLNLCGRSRWPATLHCGAQTLSIFCVRSTAPAIRNEIRCAGDKSRNQSVDIERKEPHTRYTIALYIRAHIYFGKRSKVWNWRNKWKRNVAHREWNESNPGTAIKRVHFNSLGKKRLHHSWVVSPMDISKVSPLLLHDWMLYWRRANHM